MGLIYNNSNKVNHYIAESTSDSIKRKRKPNLTVSRKKVAKACSNKHKSLNSESRKILLSLGYTLI